MSCNMCELWREVEWRRKKILHQHKEILDLKERIIEQNIVISDQERRLGERTMQLDGMFDIADGLYEVIDNWKQESNRQNELIQAMKGDRSEELNIVGKSGWIMVPGTDISIQLNNGHVIGWFQGKEPSVTGWTGVQGANDES